MKSENPRPPRIGRVGVPALYGVIAFVIGVLLTSLHTFYSERSFSASQREAVLQRLSHVKAVLDEDLRARASAGWKIVHYLLAQPDLPGRVAAFDDGNLAALFHSSDEIKGAGFFADHKLVNIINAPNMTPIGREDLGADSELALALESHPNKDAMRMLGPFPGGAPPRLFYFAFPFNDEVPDAARATPPTEFLVAAVDYDAQENRLRKAAADEGLAVVIHPADLQSGRASADFVTSPVEFGRTRWELAAKPVGGWLLTSPTLWRDRVIGWFLSLAIGSFLYFLRRQPVELKEQVDDAAAALKRSEERFRRVMASVPIGVLAADREGYITLAEGRGLAQSGLQDGGLVGRKLTDVFGVDLKGEDGDGESSDTTELTVTRDGSHFQVRLSPFESGEAEPAGLTVVVTDVTTREAAQNSLRRSESFLRSLNEITSSPGTPLLEKIDRLLSLGCAHFGMHNGKIYRKDGDDFEVVQLKVETEDFKCGTRIPGDATISKFTVLDNGVFGIHSIKGTPLESHVDFQKHGVQSYIGCVIRSGEKIYGTISFSDFEPREKPFSAQDFAFMRLMGEYLSEEYSRLEIHDQLTRRLNFERLLVNISTKFINLPFPSFDNALIEALSELGALANAECCQIFLQEDGGTAYLPRVTWLATAADKKSPAMTSLDSVENNGLFDVLERDGYFAYPSGHSHSLNDSLQQKLLSQLSRDSLLTVVPLNTGNRTAGLLAVQTKAGSLEWARENMQLLQVLAQIFGNLIDRKSTHDQLVTSRERLNTVVNSLDDMIWSGCPKTHRLLFMSPAAEKIYGRPVDAFYQDPLLWQNVVHPDDKEKVRGYLKTLQSEGSVKLEYRIIRCDGEVRWVSDRALLTRDAHGAPTRIDGILTDITDQKHSESELRESEDRFRRLASATSEGVAIIRNGVFTDVNEMICAMFGYRRSQLIGKTTADLVAAQSRPLLDRLHSYDEASHEFLGLRSDGATFPVEISERAAAQETLHSRVVVVRDITMQARALEEYRRAKEVAEQAAQLKSEFLANMSHEIRTPLHAVLAMSELLAHSNLDEDQREFLRTIHGSGRALLDLINEVLDYSKIEAGKLEIDAISFLITDLMDEVAELQQHRATAKGLQFSVEIDPDLPKYLHGDFARLRQVLINLLNNAIKFTEKGSVRVSVNAVAVNNNEASVRFAVTDTGVGIPDDRRDRLFKSFSQVDTSTTRKYGGSGLGLAISRSIVAAMNGTIEVVSNEETGSEFSFVVTLGIGTPIPPQNELAVRESHTPDSPGIAAKRIHTILIVEDNLVNQLVAQSMLRRIGFEYDTANNGRAALEKIKVNDYDLVLMDCQMPELDGYETTRAIRRLPGERGRIPIVAMTANAMKGDEEKCLEAGMDNYISKPVSLNKLRGILRALLPEPPSDKTAGRQTDPVDLPQLTNIFGGDHEARRKFIEVFLHDFQKRRAALRPLLAEGDFAALRHQAHTLKGSTANAGAKSLALLMAALEAAAKEKNRAQCLQNLDKIENEARLVTDFLTQMETSTPTAAALKPYSGVDF